MYALFETEEFGLQNRVLFTSQTNNIVNEIAGRLDAKLKRFNVTSLKVTRVYSLETEDAKFVGKHIPPHFNEFFRENGDAAFYLITVLNEAAREH
jgi:hypothetical protein